MRPGVGSLCRVLALGICLTRATWSDTPAPMGGQVKQAPVQETLGKLLGELQSRHLVPAGDDELSRRACQALLDAFATGGEVVGKHSPPPAVLAAPEPRLLTRVTDLSGRFGYLRVAAVEAGLPQAIAAARSQLPQSPDGGTVLDLRDCGGNDPGAASASAAALADRGLPVVVLVNGKTRASAEILAVEMRQNHGAVILGEPTRGLPYPLRPVQLAGGMAVMLPEVPAGMPLVPLRPDVPVAARAPAGEEERDECVRQAVDLLTAICTFRQRHF